MYLNANEINLCSQSKNRNRKESDLNNYYTQK